MENVYSCPICGSTEMKQNGRTFLCRFCKNEFSEEELMSRLNGGGSGNAAGTGNSGSGNAAPTVGSTPVTDYIGAMFGATPVPPSSGGFSAPPESLIQSIQAGAARNRQSDVLNDGRGSGNGSGGSAAGGSGRRGSGRGSNGGSGSNSGSGNGRGNGRNNGSGNNGGNSGSNNGNGGSNCGGSNGSGNVGSGSGSCGSSGGGNNSSGNNGGASDSENNVRFLDNVSLMNDLAYELVNGNANAWANIARDKGIINSKQHTEIKYIVATRNCIAHGSGDTVRITAELVASARNYYELMRRTASQIR